MRSPELVALALVVFAPQARGQDMTRADTVPPAAAMESPYTIHSGHLGLGATLTVPRGARGTVPIAVIIAGSGPTDRNGNSVMGIRPNCYAQLAWRLAERGIATLRYDKRGLPGTQGMFDITRMTLEDFAADARAAAESLARDRRFSRVVLVGHSEGASLALIAARQGAPVAGVISVSGLGRPLAEVMRDQLSRQVDSATMVRYDTAMKHYLRGEQPGDVPPQVAMLFVPSLIVSGTDEAARTLLSDLLPASRPRVITPQLILEETAKMFGFTVDELCGKSRRRPLVTARQIGMYVFRELTDYSYPKIAEEFGGRDHTTVMHACEKIRGQMAERRVVFEQVNELINRIKHGASG